MEIRRTRICDYYDAEDMKSCERFAAFLVTAKTETTPLTVSAACENHKKILETLPIKEGDILKFEKFNPVERLL